MYSQSKIIKYGDTHHNKQESSKQQITGGNVPKISDNESNVDRNYRISLFRNNKI